VAPKAISASFVAMDHAMAELSAPTTIRNSAPVQHYGQRDSHKREREGKGVKERKGKRRR